MLSISSRLPVRNTGGFVAGQYQKHLFKTFLFQIDPSDEQFRLSEDPQVGFKRNLLSTVECRRHLVKSRGNGATFIRVPVKGRSTSARHNAILHLMGNSKIITTALTETSGYDSDGEGTEHLSEYSDTPALCGLDDGFRSHIVSVRPGTIYR